MKKVSKKRLFEVMGILDKTFKPRLNENEDNITNTESSVDNENNEGALYKAKLEEIVDLSKKIYESLQEDEIPAWVQDKIVIAKEKLSDINDWLHGNEESREGEESGANRKMDDDSLNNSDDAESDNEKNNKTNKIPVVDIAKTGSK